MPLEQPDGAAFLSVLCRSVAAKVSTCSVCERTGWWGYLQNCPRPQSCTSSTSQETGLSPCLLLAPSGKELYQQWAKCLKWENNIHFLPCGYPVLHDCRLSCVGSIFFAVFLGIVSAAGKSPAVVRLLVYRWSSSIYSQSITFLSFQAAKPADLPDLATSQGLVAVGEPVTASPDFSDGCGSRDGREGAHLCAAASTAQRWQQR